jgi:hypothetical protein
MKQRSYSRRIAGVLSFLAVALMVGTVGAAPGGNGATVEKDVDFTSAYSNECVAPGVFSPISGTLHIVRHTRTDKDGVTTETVQANFSNVTGIDVLTGEPFRVVGKRLKRTTVFYGDPFPYENAYTIHMIRVDKGSTPNEHYEATVYVSYDEFGNVEVQEVEVTIDCRG